MVMLANIYFCSLNIKANFRICAHWHTQKNNVYSLSSVLDLCLQFLRSFLFHVIKRTYICKESQTLLNPVFCARHAIKFEKETQTNNKRY